MRVSTVMVIGVMLLAFVAGLTAQDDPTNEATELYAGVPIGSVILWWGLKKDIPDGFEVCDGRKSSSRDATFRMRKPDLLGRFPVGAPDENRFRPWADNRGQLMTHVHGVASHSHTVDNHDHSLGDHTHTFSAHTHAVDVDKTTVTVATPDDGQVEITFYGPVADKANPNASITSGGADSDVSGKAVGDTGKDSPGTSDSKPVQTAGPTAANGGTGEVGASFTQFLFIIRVK